MRHLNYKALALGTVLGFIVAVAPSCGSTASSCGPANCNTGCCDNAGKCVTTPPGQVQSEAALLSQDQTTESSLIWVI